MQVYPDMPAAEYRALPQLSSTGARRVLRSPAHLRATQDDADERHTEAMDFGQLVHTLVLGDGRQVVVVDADSWRTKAAREERDAAWEAGAVPALPQALAVAEQMAAVVREHPAAAALLGQPGRPEVSVVWGDRKARFDWLPDGPMRSGRMVAVDFKTAEDASVSGFRSAVGRYWYPVQAEWYCDALRAMGHDDPGFCFVVQEKDPPYAVAVHELDEQARRLGADLGDLALRTWRRCVAEDAWPGYPGQVQTVGLPAWAVLQAEEMLA